MTLTTVVLGSAVAAAALTVTPAAYLPSIGGRLLDGVTGATLLAFGLRLAAGPAPR